MRFQESLLNSELKESTSAKYVPHATRPLEQKRDDRDAGRGELGLRNP